MTPSKKRGQSPDEGIDPRHNDAQGALTVVGGVCLSGCHYGAVALIGEDCQGDQGHDACSRMERTHSEREPLNTFYIRAVQQRDAQHSKYRCCICASIFVMMAAKYRSEYCLLTVRGVVIYIAGNSVSL